MSLLSILCIFLLSSYRQITALSSTLEKKKYEQLKLAHAHALLSKIVKKAVLPESQYKSDFCFYSVDLQGKEQQSLIFTFNNGIDPDPKFSQEVLAKLSLTSSGYLILSLWPLPSRWKDNDKSARTELLLENISSLSFQFYYFNDKKLPVQPSLVDRGREKLTPPSGWQRSWLKGYGQLPMAIKVHMQFEKENQPFEFSLFLPQSQKEIVFQSKEG